jgi:hypothetical protein
MIEPDQPQFVPVDWKAARSGPWLGEIVVAFAMKAQKVCRQ